MTVEIRKATTADIEAITQLWAEYVPQTQFSTDLEVDLDITRSNLFGLLVGGDYIKFIAEKEGVAVGFLHARVERWLFNNQPFVSEVALYPGKEPTEAAGTSLLRAMHKEMEEKNIKNSVAAFYSGIEEKKLSALLATMGYTHAGLVMKRGF